MVDVLGRFGCLVGITNLFGVASNDFNHGIALSHTAVRGTSLWALRRDHFDGRLRGIATINAVPSLQLQLHFVLQKPCSTQRMRLFAVL